jgi:hypothetical protein
VRWDEHRDFVIRRILVDGTWEQVSWLRHEVGDLALRDWIIRHEGHGLSSQQLRFWEVVVQLPSDQVEVWLQSAERKIWEGRVRR